MRLLALETANEHCSVAIIQNNEITFFACDERSKMQTQVILPMVEQALTENHLSLHDLDAIAFSRGPGAFSGVRINATVAQALAWSNDLPVISISSLQALAWRAYQQFGLTQITPVLDARMQEVYIANYQISNQNQHTSLQAVSDECLLSYEQAQAYGQFCCVGSGANLVQADSNEAYVQLTATAKDIAYLAYQTPQQEWLNADQALPVYLRNDAWKKIDKQGKA